MSHLLELRNATKVFKGGTVALDNFSFWIDAGAPSIVSVAGESGSGKTTLGLMILGFLEPSAGTVLYKGRELGKLNNQERSAFRKEVQAVFQDPFAVYNPFYKVDHIMEVPIKNFRLAKSHAEARRMIEEALVSVGLRPEETLGRFPHQLSGGQRQRLAVARALLLRPNLLIADEPVSMVDASLRATILESINKLNSELNVTVLYITHDLTTAYHVSDYIIILYRGSVMEAGDVDTVITEPKHPYTQLLIDSIPWPDITRQWGQHEIVSPEEDKSVASQVGCKFAGRCPHVMPICTQSPPPLYQVDGQRVAACYLYESSPVLPGEQLGGLFKSRKIRTPSPNGADAMPAAVKTTQ
ncbi:MAG TPA: ABC transporter ATP-binding protein [Caldilineaceae bacterium]|nr:ABC transporter ATP-binding protein [Caldilineaceae bacterium]